jgi:hypothetical protein
MTSQALAVPRALDALREPRPSIVLAVSIAALLFVGAAAAKQQCSAEAGKQGSWSWRMIDGRKCWYEGKPMLSRALLEWPAESAAIPDAAAASAAPAIRRPERQRSEGAPSESTPSESHGDPMDAQAYAPADSPTFDALWRDRIEGSKK